jgi:hypothetical protein
MVLSYLSLFMETFYHVHRQKDVVIYFHLHVQHIPLQLEKTMIQRSQDRIVLLNQKKNYDLSDTLDSRMLRSFLMIRLHQFVMSPSHHLLENLVFLFNSGLFFSFTLARSGFLMVIKTTKLGFLQHERINLYT